VLLHFETCEHVLGDGFGRHALRREEGSDTKHCGGASTKGCAPGILGGHDDFEKESLLVRPGRRAYEICLNGIGIEKVLRSLDNAHIRLREQAERAFQYIDARDEIGIEQEDEFRPASGREGVREAVVIARFRMLSLDPEDIMRPELMREVADEATRFIRTKTRRIGMIDCHVQVRMLVHYRWR
jgi:hypothetical protein